MKAGREPTIGALVAGGARWWAVFTFTFLLTFPLWGRALLAVLRFILEGLNSVGAP